MTIVGRATRTASVNAAALNTSTTTGIAPTAVILLAFAADRVAPKTSKPLATRIGTSRLPMAPVAPAKNTRRPMDRFLSWIV